MYWRCVCVCMNPSAICFKNQSTIHLLCLSLIFPFIKIEEVSESANIYRMEENKKECNVFYWNKSLKKKYGEKGKK